MKAVILAGSDGTRLHPLTLVTDKHLLPVYDRPMVSYAVEAALKAGVRELMLITGGGHAGDFFRLLGDGRDSGADRLFYAVHEESGGVGQALRLAQRFVDGDDMMLLLADNVFEHGLEGPASSFAGDACRARMLLARVDDVDQLSHLSVVELEGDRVARVVHKPERPPSSYAITGACFLDASVWDVLDRLEGRTSSAAGIADLVNYYIENDVIAFDIVDGFWGNAGESIDAYYAVNDFVRFHGVNKD